MGSCKGSPLSYKILSDQNDSIGPSIMSVSEVVLLSPFQFYNVTINATTGGGSSSASSSARSPEAGESVEDVSLVHYITACAIPT